jgi:hypothetical protein
MHHTEYRGLPWDSGLPGEFFTLAREKTYHDLITTGAMSFFVSELRGFSGLCFFLQTAKNFSFFGIFVNMAHIVCQNSGTRS